MLYFRRHVNWAVRIDCLEPLGQVSNGMIKLDFKLKCSDFAKLQPDLSGPDVKSRGNPATPLV